MLKVEETNKKFALPMKFVNVTQGFRPSTGMDYATIYTINATFRIDVASTEQDLLTVRHAEKVANARRAITRELFSEFMRPLFDVQRALYNHDTPEAERLVRSVIESMDNDVELK